VPGRRVIWSGNFLRASLDADSIPSGPFSTLTSSVEPNRNFKPGVSAVSYAIPGIAAMMKEAVFRWSFTYAHHAGGRDVDSAAALLARRPEIADTLITHRFPLADAPEAFRVAADRAHGAIKVVLEPA
jgi:threonine dehydrogenase-like Zn-dependent dehydrogenase